MSLFTLVLPLHAAGPEAEYAHAFSSDGHSLQTEGNARIDLLPRSVSPGCETVLVVPACALSWHRVELPRASLAPRAQGRLPRVLQGLLEERVLDEVEHCHWALQPQAREAQPIWVAACRCDWLQAHLDALEHAGFVIARCVPECTPDSTPDHTPDSSAWTVQALEGPHGPLLRASGPGAPQTVPLGASGLAWLRARQSGADAASTATGTPASATPAALFAEPALVQALQALWPEAQVTPQTAAERSLLATQSAWDLAQFELAGAGQRRLRRQAGKAWQAFWNAPRWRLARNGLLALALVQIVGLNAWAWHERALLAQERQAVRDTLTETFPQVRLVIDAPLQMRREMARLQQAAGARSRSDLEAVLQALGETLPTDTPLLALDHSPDATQLRGPALAGVASAGFDALQSRLRERGYQLRREPDHWTLKALDPATPSDSERP